MQELYELPAIAAYILSTEEERYTGPVHYAGPLPFNVDAEFFKPDYFGFVLKNPQPMPSRYIATQEGLTVELIAVAPHWRVTFTWSDEKIAPVSFYFPQDVSHRAACNLLAANGYKPSMNNEDDHGS